MSIPQIPTSRKAEYLVYLGFAGAVCLLITTILPPDLRTVLDPHLALFVTVITTALAGLLFSVRMDKIVDIVIARYVGKKERMEKIIEFVARVLVFLKFWEVSPTRIAPLNAQAKGMAMSIIEGEDLHEEVWTQKGIFFLTLSVLVIGFTIVVSDTASINATLLAIGMIVLVLGPVLLLMIWAWRYREFPDRCEEVLKYRYYQDQLLTERLLRSKRRPSSKEESGSTSWKTTVRKTILWDSDELEDYKVALVNQCEEIDKILRRKEWNRFESQFLAIMKMLEKSTKSFIETDALSFAVLALSELLAPNNKMEVEGLEARFDSFKLSISPLVKDGTKLSSFSLGPDASEANLQGLLYLIEPKNLNPTLYTKVGNAIGRTLEDSNNPEAISTITKWLKADSDCILSTLKLLNVMNPLSYEDLLRAQPLASDEECVSAVMKSISAVSYHDAEAAFPILAVLPKNDAVIEEVLEYLTAAVTSDDFRVQLWAVDALAQMDIGLSKHPRVVEAFNNILEMGHDESVLAVLFALSRMTELLLDHPMLTNTLFNMLPHRNQYIQKKLHELLHQGGLANEDFGTILLQIGQSRAPLDASSTTSSSCSKLIKQSASSAPKAAIKALIDLNIRASDCFSRIENVQKLLDAARRTSQPNVRILIASIIGINASLIAADYHIAIAKEIFEIVKEISSLQIRYIFGYTLGCFDRSVQFELARRIKESEVTALAAIAMYYMNEKLSSEPEIMRGITSEMDRNFDSRIACVLAAMALGTSVQNYPALLDKIIALMETQNTVIATCALECLRTVGGKRVYDALKSTKRKMDRWWLRNIYRKCLEENP